MKTHSGISPILPELVMNLFAAMPDLVFIMGMDTQQRFHYLRMNPAAMRASGLNEEAYGATFQDVVAPEESEFLHWTPGRRHAAQGNHPKNPASDSPGSHPIPHRRG